MSLSLRTGLLPAVFLCLAVGIRPARAQGQAQPAAAATQAAPAATPAPATPAVSAARAQCVATCSARKTSCLGGAEHTKTLCENLANSRWGNNCAVCKATPGRTTTAGKVATAAGLVAAASVMASANARGNESESERLQTNQLTSGQPRPDQQDADAYAAHRGQAQAATCMQGCEASKTTCTNREATQAATCSGNFKGCEDACPQ